MRRRILPRLAAIGILVLALAGCVRFQADLDVTSANTVDGSIVVAVLNSDDSDEGRETARASADEIATVLLGALADAPGVTVSDYESDDDYIGYALELSAVPFEAFSGGDPDSLHFAREGDQIVFSGALDFTDQSTETEEGQEGDDSNLTVSITFPGAVTEHNGELSGTTVSWRTPVEERLEMTARASATPPGPPLGLIIGIAVGVLVLLVVVGLVLFLVLRSRRSAPAAVAPAPVTPDPVAPTAVEAPPAPAGTAAPAEKPRTPRAPKAPKEPPATPSA